MDDHWCAVKARELGVGECERVAWRWCRRFLRMSQSELARLAKLTQRTYSRIESGDRATTLDERDRIRAALLRARDGYLGVTDDPVRRSKRGRPAGS